jgi:hypothetical protein
LAPLIGITHTQVLERVTTEKRVLSARLSDANTLNQKLILQKVNGELSAEDFAAAKETVTQQSADVEKQLNALDTEIVIVEGRAHRGSTA